MSVIESANLYFKAGNSDKVYNATLESAQEGYIVNFSYGRRGSALKSGSKTTKPVNIDEAKKIFNSLVGEKTSKGYRQIEGATISEIYVATNLPDTPVDSKCVLLNPIEESEVNKYIDHPDWIAQNKFDGVRFMLEHSLDGLCAYNRKGLRANIPTLIYNTKFSKHFLLDGELVGDIYYVFDILSYEGKEIVEMPFFKRVNILGSLINEIKSECIVFADVYYTKEEKYNFYKLATTENHEGIVFKNKNAAYHAGRPASGGDYLKHKFYSTCSCVVTSINDKRSVSIGLYDKRKLVKAGNVTIPINFEIPKVDSVVEVKYLYARKQSGSLYQPVYLGERIDIEPLECSRNQLKYKKEDE